MSPTCSTSSETDLFASLSSPERKRTSRLLQLLDAAGGDALEDALVEVLERGTIHIGAVRQVIDRQRSERGLALPLTIPLTPSEHSDLVVTPHALATYDTLKKDENHDH